MANSLDELKSLGVLMVDSHFDYGNGYHGTMYCNPHGLFQHPGTIWRFAQDLIARMPSDIVAATEVGSGDGRSVACAYDRRPPRRPPALEPSGLLLRAPFGG